MKKTTVFERIWNKKIMFFIVYFVVFTVSYLILVAIDFLPEAPTDTETSVTTEVSTIIDDSAETTQEAETVVVQEITAVPRQIYIEKIDKNITVLNPVSRNIADLDTALLDGVVRHPDSAKLGQEGNVFILGHSSYLPTVFNSNFQAFNGIQNLEWGDTIEVTSDDAVYVYRVEKTFKAKAQDVTVPIAGEDKLLTLATCNSFGSVDDRYIVEARQVEVRTI